MLSSKLDFTVGLWDSAALLPNQEILHSLFIKLTEEVVSMKYWLSTKLTVGTVFISVSQCVFVSLSSVSVSVLGGGDPTVTL